MVSPPLFDTNCSFKQYNNSFLDEINVAKCNLGKVNLEAMLSSCLRMQEACLQPWRFAGTLCDAHMQWAATAGRTKLGVAQDSRRGLS